MRCGLASFLLPYLSGADTVALPIPYHNLSLINCLFDLALCLFLATKNSCFPFSWVILVVSITENVKCLEIVKYFQLFEEGIFVVVCFTAESKTKSHLVVAK